MRINPGRRLIQFNDVLAACVIAGTDKAENHFGNGSVQTGPVQSPAILIGGTLPAEEKRFVSGLADHWFVLNSDKHTTNALQQAGVLVRQ